MFANELGALNADFFGPPQQGQTYTAYQTQMSPIVMSGIAVLAVVNPVIGIAAGIGYLLTRQPVTKAANRFSQDELKGGH